MSPALSSHRNAVIHGDCVSEMSRIARGSVDFVLTNPPYLCRYRSRTGEAIANDDCDDWLVPAFAQMHRVLRANSFCPQLLWLERRRQVHRGLACCRLLHGRASGLHQTIRFLFALHAEHA